MLDLIDHPLTGTPFGTALTVCVLIAAAAWLLSVVTREFSGWIGCGHLSVDLLPDRRGGSRLRFGAHQSHDRAGHPCGVRGRTRSGA